MSGARVYPKSDDSNVTESIEMQESSSQHSEAMQIIQTIECNDSNKVKDDDSVRQTEPSTKSFATASEDLSEDEFEDEDFSWIVERDNIRYIHLDRRAKNELVEAFCDFGMRVTDVVFQILSDSECDSDADKMIEALEREPNDSTQNNRKIICSSIVEAASATKAWILTGGLNKGVDQLIGNEVKQRLANRNQLPQLLLGISNWKCIAEKSHLLNISSDPNGDAFDIVPVGLSLNQHHSYFLLFDYGTQAMSDCKITPQDLIEEKIRHGKLIYVLVGGRINVLSVVKRALADERPVIIATGTGGAADAISQALTPEEYIGPTLEYLPEIADTLFNRLEELLIAGGILDTVVRQTLTNIKTESKLELLFEIAVLLDQARISKRRAQQFKEEIAQLAKTSTCAFLAGIKDLLISKKSRNNRSSHSTADAECHTIDRLRAVIEQLLVVNGIPLQNAQQVIDVLESDVLNETLTRVKRVYTDLIEIRTHERKHLLIVFDIASMVKEDEDIPSSIVDTLKKVNHSQGESLYVLVSQWDNETFFRQLLQEDWMRQDHEEVFTLHLTYGRIKYVKVMLEYVGDRTWLTKPGGPLVGFWVTSVHRHAVSFCEFNYTGRVCVKSNTPARGAED